jgi:hypothetical protein
MVMISNPKVGKNAEAVGAFLSWVESMSDDAIDEVVAQLPVLRVEGGKAATDALRAGIVPTTVHSALMKPVERVHFAIQARHEYADPLDSARFRINLKTAATALAVREKLSPADFSVLTAPFRAAGYDFDAPVVTEG